MTHPCIGLPPSRAARPTSLVVPLAVLLFTGLGIATAATDVPAPDRLLANPSAEEGTLVAPTGWDTTDAGLPTVRFSWDTSTAHQGSHSLYVINTSDYFPLWHNWNQTLTGINYLAGKDLILRAWVKTRQVTGKAYILLQAYRDTVLVESLKDGSSRIDKRQQMGFKPTEDPQLELGWARKQVSGDQPEWTPIEARVYIPPTTNVIFVRAGILGIGEAWFDDFTLTAAPASPERPFPLGKNLLVDPGFEGNLDDWSVSMAPVEGLRIRPVPEPHTGLQSCLIEGQKKAPVQMWSHVYQVFNTRALSGKRVRLSGWYKSKDLNNTFACFSIYATGSYGSFRPVVSGAWSGTHDWTFATCEADIPANSYTVWARAVLNTGAGKVWFDDLKFEVLGDTPRAQAPSGKRAPPRRASTGARR